MAAMVYPELYKRGANLTISGSKYILNKYRHRLNWKNYPSIFEFGFGEGSNSKYALTPLLSKDYKEYIVSDISEKMIIAAKANFNLPKMQFIQFDITTQNLPNSFKQRFDHILSFYTMHLLQNPDKGFENIYNMLAKNGEIFILTFEHNPVAPVFRHLAKHPKWGKYPQLRMVSPYDLTNNPRKCYYKALKETGFSDIYLEPEEIIYNFKDYKEACDLYLAVNAVLPDIPKELLGEYKEYYMEQIKMKTLCSYDSKEDGSYWPQVKYTVDIIHAKKI